VIHPLHRVSVKMDARIKSGHDGERPWEEEGGRQPLFDPTTEPEIAGTPAQQE
jgi:hypothetical protein